MAYCSVDELEKKIWNVEHIRVVIRAAKTTQFPEYNYVRAFTATSSITEWINGRLRPIIEDTEFSIIDGDGGCPHGKTNIETVRRSYS